MARRRGQGEGTISKRADGRWMARISLPDGRRRAFYGATRAAAEKALQKARRELADGLPIPSGRLTVGDLLDQWLAAKAQTTAMHTQKTREAAARLHVRPRFGKVPAARLQPSDVEEMYAEMREAGLSVRTAHHAVVVLRSAYAYAIRHGALSRNVAALAEVRGPGRTAERILSSAEVRRLITAAGSFRLGGAVVLAATLGCRQGEILALRWQDLDLERKQVTIAWSLTRIPAGTVVPADAVVLGDRWALKPPKSEQSRRTLPLPAIAAAALARRLHAFETERKKAREAKAGDIWQNGEWVFGTKFGTHTEPGHLTKRTFYPALIAAGLPRVRFHSLRHSAATQMLEAGLELHTAAAFLGHSRASVTLNLYAHVIGDRLSAVADAMEKLYPAELVSKLVSSDSGGAADENSSDSVN